MAIKCNECGANDVSVGSVFCHRCGARIAMPDDAQVRSMTGKLTPPAGHESILDQPRSGTASAPTAPGVGAPTASTSNAKTPAERDIWTVQFSPRGMIGSWIIVGLLVAACLIVALFTLVAWPWMILASAVIVLIQQCRYWYRRLNDRYRLTSYRLLQETGIISRTVNRVELIDIEDIQLVRSLIDRMVGIGSIVLLTHDVSHPKMRISAIDDVEKRFDELEQAMRLEKRRREFRLEQS